MNFNQKVYQDVEAIVKLISYKSSGTPSYVLHRITAISRVLYVRNMYTASRDYMQNI